MLCNEPHLGLATTEELIREIIARGETEIEFDLTGYSLAKYCRELINILPYEMLKYKTVGDQMKHPTLGRIVWYRGRQGFQTMRAAVVTCTVNELDPRGVEQNLVENLNSPMHVHLDVFTPSRTGSFPEFNIPFGVPGEDGKIPPGTWCWPEIKHSDG